MARQVSLRVALGIAVAAATLAALAAVPRGLPADTPPSGCPEPFPRAVLPLSLGAGSSGVRICTDAAGASTLVINTGPAVWVLDGAPPQRSIRVRLSDSTRSFVDLVGGPAGAIPSGAAAVAQRSPSEVGLRVDARLTVAQLTHDQLLRALDHGRGLADAAIAPRPSAARRALSACLTTVLDALPPAGEVLTSAEPAGTFASSLRSVDLADGFCGRSWLEAQVVSGMPSGSITGFAYDAFGWAEDQEFTIRVEGAARMYRRLLSEDQATAYRRLEWQAGP
ncbi:hypothetical protein [Naasia sp. SYSU D00057]|uniref:hypothetical protein n=1 Tax=Naasia sp. SYSU D00057 TaxID=2817380 RepID=UPI001B3058C1|nr:hypothetical protein [Naasia sp. SYSU D00057]